MRSRSGSPHTLQRRIRGERYARHWHVLAAMARSSHFPAVLSYREVAEAVAKHKACFLIEKDSDGHDIDYFAVNSGHLRIVPEGEARVALEADYKALLAHKVLIADAFPFEMLLQAMRRPRSEGESSRPVTAAKTIGIPCPDICVAQAILL